MPGPGPEEARNVPMAFVSVNDAHSWATFRSEGKSFLGEADEKQSGRDIPANSGRPLGSRSRGHCPGQERPARKARQEFDAGALRGYTDRYVIQKKD